MKITIDITNAEAEDLRQIVMWTDLLVPCHTRLFGSMGSTAQFMSHERQVLVYKVLAALSHAKWPERESLFDAVLASMDEAANARHRPPLVANKETVPKRYRAPTAKRKRKSS